ncbi:MAG: 1-acyl-sn-glycerol-3-phosphate acyltransferase [Proteobacteria bacterium]|nr:1-acyl-sn-glycerol-3-phosphate acyltransferase [Pseudomonadota bacterium]
MVVLAMVLLVPIHLVWRRIRYGSPIPMLFLALISRMAGARVVRHGTPLRRNVMFTANHVSWLDIPAMAGLTGCAFVAKAEVGTTPLIGWLASLNRTVFVDREARMAVAEQVNELREALADAWSITIFPEGTTTDGHSLLPFKSSMLRVLEPPPATVLVQPVMLDYGAVAEWIGWVGDEPGMGNILRIFARPGSFPLHIHFLTPFDPRDYPGRKAIAAECQRRVGEALTAALGHPLRPFRHHVGPVRYRPPENDVAA